MNDVDIERMAREMDIGMADIKDALGIPMSEECNASTIGEARVAYHRALGGSEAERAAMEKWEELSLEEVKSASTADEAKEAYDRTPGGSEAEKAAIKKLATFFPAGDSIPA